MVKKLSGYILIGLGFLGVVFFKSYRGDIIPFPILWLTLSLGVVAIGTYLRLTAKTKKQVQKLNDTEAKIDRIKEKGEKILIDLDNCDFKTNNVIDQSNVESFSRTQMIDALYDPNHNHARSSKVTYIIYNHKNGNIYEKFVSQPFSIDETTLKYYVSNNKIVLYIDRHDRKYYFFNVE